MICGKNKHCQNGFLIMEIMLALAIAVCALAAAVLFGFSGQMMAGDAELDFEALDLAQKLVEEQKILAADDFRRVNPTSRQEGIFSAEIETAPFSYFVKSVDAVVGWNIGGRPRQTKISILIADYNATAGDDTCNSNPAGDWANPQIIKEIDFSQFAADASSTFAIGDVDAYKGKLYVAVAKTGVKTDPVFFAFDIADPASPVFLYSFDNNKNGRFGFSDLKVSGDHIYLAGNYDANFSTCATGPNCAQLQIFNLDNYTMSNFKIPGTGNGAGGESVFYKNGYVYLGLHKNSGVEFSIIDVKNPADPALAGGFEIDAGVNDIYVKGDYAYLAHPANLTSAIESGREQLTILNIADPAGIYRVGGFYHPGGLGGNGKSLQVIGGKIYFGRTTSHISGPPDAIADFFILENSSPVASPTVTGSVAFSEVNSANGVFIRQNLAFILGAVDLKIFEIGNPANIVESGNLSFNALAGEEFEPSFDCEGNIFFAGSNKNDRGYLSVVAAQ